jgi:hypothetical protein
MKIGLDFLVAYTCLFAIFVFVGWIGVFLAMGMWLAAYLTRN